jgi:hypothetical protein
MSLDAISEQWEILLFALILGAAHLIAPRAYAIRRDPERWQAFGGGLSAAYVFLHLLPSLDTFHAVLGQGIYFITLLGFVAFYALDLRYQPPRHHHPTKYHVYLAAFFLYYALLVFTLGLNLPSTPILTMLFAVSLALDAVENDIELQETYGARFVRSGRWVLLAGVAFGYSMNLVRRPHVMYIDILTAALTGFMIFHTFVGLFPVSRTRKFPAFVAGMLTFLSLHVLLGSAG